MCERSIEACRLIMPVRQPKVDFGEEFFQTFFQSGHNRVFRAEMITVDQINAQLAGKQERTVFDVCSQIGIAAGTVGVDKIVAAGTA